MAHVMFDLGSSIEALSPHYSMACRVKVFELEDQESLQLGTIGSCAKFEYGTWSLVIVNDNTIPTWWDIVNIDKYSAIISMKWMRANQVILDFTQDLIIINGHHISALTAKEDAIEVSHRMSMRQNE